MKIGVYPGTFDPVTYGHTDIIARSLRVFDKVIIAVAPNPTKRPLFDLTERVEMVKLVTNGLPHVEVVTFKGLLVEYVQKRKAHAVIRGLRAISDFDASEHFAARAQEHIISDLRAAGIFSTISDAYCHTMVDIAVFADHRPVEHNRANTYQ